MTPIQLFILTAIAVVGAAILVSFGSLAYAYWNFRKQRTEERSLLKRLEDVSSQTKAQAQPRKKYYVFWSR